MVDIVAIPVLDNDVAPCFEVAHRFVLVEIKDGIRDQEAVQRCSGCEGYGPVKFLLANRVNILICNGIKLFYKDLLNISGIEVISDIADSVENALEAYLSGSFARQAKVSDSAESGSEIPHGDLVCWARELFESNGYTVFHKPGHLPFLIDLVAEIPCPLCRKNIRVGICCGAHTYRVANEIIEFHHIAPNEFNAKVYVYPSNPGICKTCGEYGIELIDPNAEDKYVYRKTAEKIPVLRNPVAGHEKACMSLSEEKNDY